MSIGHATFFFYKIDPELGIRVGKKCVKTKTFLRSLFISVERLGKVLREGYDVTDHFETLSLRREPSTGFLYLHTLTMKCEILFGVGIS